MLSKYIDSVKNIYNYYSCKHNLITLKAKIIFLHY